MVHRAKLIDARVLSQVQNLTVKARTVMEGLLTGQHKSPHKGSSVEFAEHKEYSPGDEIRHIDWQLYAKTDKYYVKQFEEETNLKCYMLLDVSASMGYGSGDHSKLDFATQLAAALSYMLLRQSDAVGMMLFSRGPVDYLPPRSRSAHLQDLLATMVRATAADKTDLGDVLNRLSEVARRRSLIVLLSDLFDTSPAVLSRLKQHRARGHDVTVFHIMDRAELEFPFEDQTLFLDMEEESLKVEANPKTIRAAYLEEIESYVDGLKRVCQESDIEYRLAPSDSPLERVLAEFVARRAHG